MRLVTLPKKAINALKKNGSALLKQIEQQGTISLKIEDDNVVMEGDGGTEWIAEQVLKALGYGFFPKQAFKLFTDTWFLEVINLEQAFHGNEKKMIRYKARIIGQGGAAKKKLQDLSGAFIAVGSRQVAIMGEFEELKACKEAILRLLEGCEHSSVYAYLEKEKQRQRRLI